MFIILLLNVLISCFIVFIIANQELIINTHLYLLLRGLYLTYKKDLLDILIFVILPFLLGYLKVKCGIRF